MQSTIVHLVRHGEVHNPDRVLYGRLPGFRLSERGLAMADAAAKFFVGRTVQAVVSSPLERACQTAEPIAAVCGVSVTHDSRVIEAENRFEGHCVPTQLRRPVNWPMLWNPLRPSWGEPYRVIARRMAAAVCAARESNAGGEVVIVSHQLPIWVTYLSATGQGFLHDPRRRRCDLASITSLHFVGTQFTGATYVDPVKLAGL